MNKILITGANGLLGRQTIKTFCEHHEVHALVHRLPEDRVANVVYHEIDLSKSWNTDQFPQAADVIIHLAQSSRFREFPDQALDVFNVNVDSTARLLDYAKNAGVKKFFYASSGGVYGSGKGAFDEDTPINMNKSHGYYVGSKLCGEMLVQTYASLMDVTVLRIFFMYGSGQQRSMLIPRLVDNVLEGRSIMLQGKNGIRINPVHVTDAVAVIAKCLDMKGSRFINVAGPEVLSLREIAESISLHLNKPAIFEALGGEASDLIADNLMMKSLLKKGLMPLRDGLKDII